MSTKRINVITGRNNSGKTSLLESVDLAFNPGNVENYGGNISDLIQANKKAANLNVGYSERQKSIEDFAGEMSNRDRNIKIRRPEEDELASAFFEMLYKIVGMNESYPIRLNQDLHDYVRSTETSESLHDQIENILLDTISEIPEDYIISKIRGNCVILEIANETYPRIYFGEDYSEIRAEIEIQAVDQYLSQYLKPADIDADGLSRMRENLKSNFHRLLAPRFARGRFVGPSPESLPGVVFLKRPNNIKDRVDMGRDNSAVIVDNIEEYLKENDIAEGLSDFSFNKLVFDADPRKEEIPYDFMGDGFKSIVGVLWEVLSEETRNNVLLLEEPGIHMHPGYINNLISQLIKVSEDKDIQLFMTTHSSDLIDSFFSNPIQEEWYDYLEEHFQLIQMTDPISQSFDYTEADETLTDLHLDLRGI